MNKLLLWELIGIVFIVFLGSFMHFTYELSGKNVIVGAFSAVNESTWEHLKLAVFPALLFMLIEYRWLNKKANFFFAKALGISLMPLSIVALFYAYTAVMPDNFVMDILIFIIAVVIGQMISYRLMKPKKASKTAAKIARIVLILLPILFVLLTFFPPEIFLFQDPISGKYSIAAEALSSATVYGISIIR